MVWRWSINRWRSERNVKLKQKALWRKTTSRRSGQNPCSNTRLTGLPFFLACPIPIFWHSSPPAIQFIRILICFHQHMAHHQPCIIIITSWESRLCPGDTDGRVTPSVALLLGLCPRLGLHYSGFDLGSGFTLNSWALRALDSGFALKFYILLIDNNIIRLDSACFLCHPAHMYQTYIFYSCDSVPLQLTQLWSTLWHVRYLLYNNDVFVNQGKRKVKNDKNLQLIAKLLSLLLQIRVRQFIECSNSSWSHPCLNLISFDCLDLFWCSKWFY